MNPSPLTPQQTFHPPRGLPRAGVLACLLVAGLLLHELAVSAQDPSPPGTPNRVGLGPTGPAPEFSPAPGLAPGTPLTPSNEPAPLSSTAPTNGFASTNSPVQSNDLEVGSEPASTNELSQTNLLAQPNSGGPNASSQAGFSGQTGSGGNRDYRNNRDSSRNRDYSRNRGSSRGGGYGSSGFSSEPASTNRLEFGYYRLIFERNIFNPNRRPSSGPFFEQPRDYTPPRRTDTFSLVGTMAYGKGVFAFFDGSSYQYRKTAKPGEIIAGYGISEVGHDYVKLVSKTNQLELRIGMQMRRDDGGDWSLRNQFGGLVTAASSGASDATAGGTNALAAAGDPSAPPIIPADSKEAEILKRLMERRAQELSK